MSGRSNALEVYVQRQGQWTLSSRHKNSERDTAIEEAKKLESRSNIAAVRVIREIYDEAENHAEEYIIYESGSSTKDASAKKPNAPGAGAKKPKPAANLYVSEKSVDPPADQPAPTDLPTPRPLTPNRFSKTFLKLILIFTAATIVAALVTGVAAAALSEVPELRNLIGFGSRGEETTLFFIFLISFVLSLIASAIGRLPASPRSRHRPAQTADTDEDSFAANERKQWSQTFIPLETPATERKKRAAAAVQRARDSAAHNEPVESDAPSSAHTTAKMEQAPAPPPPPLKIIPISPAAEPHQATIMGFLSKGLETTIATRPRLNNFNKLGISLYLAGACDAVGQSEDIADHDIAAILRQGVQLLGNDQNQAARFARDFESYLMEPRYLNMIEAGRDAMSAHLADTPDAPLKLKEALDRWNSHTRDATESGGTITLMFTDIAGSTDLTQQHGDATAQDVVRLHNRVVRAALTAHQGREVKHLGDGIMAAFNNTSDAVKAAIRIQRRVLIENDSAAVPFDIKIGINAGEPVVEDNDLFGSTVQLAARIVDAAKARQIFVSEVVRGICNGKDFRFQDRGDRSLKGFKEPVPIYEVMWKAEVTEPKTEISGPAAAAIPVAATAPLRQVS